MKKTLLNDFSFREWLSARPLVRKHGPLRATVIVTLGTFVIVSSIITVVALYTGFPILPGIVVTVLIHFLLMPQTYQTHQMMAELDSTHAALYHTSITDELTGAHNRRFFMDELQRAMASARQWGKTFAVVQFDIDDFKRLNDTFGHQFGDQALYLISTLCKNQIRQTTDTFARIGGEEFAFLLKNTSQKDAMLFAERLRLAIQLTDIEHPAGKACLTVSMGVSSYQPQMTIDDILRAGDQAMYLAKSKGKNCVMPAQQ